MPFRSLYPDVAIPEVALSAFVLRDAAARGDKPALIDGPSGRTITYGQLPGWWRARPPAWPAAASRRASASRSTARTCPSTPSPFTRSPRSAAS